ncbi:MAG: peptide deformylase [Candidatus Rokubacteria bacterium 13_1_40CM_4_69_5]|nr:MAG: peptide deformylase [Candidatus Rokubacteria bacterium 13_1_40CM_4_69_5]
MAVLKVRKYGDPILRRRAEPVRAITSEIRTIVADMVDTMYDEVGIGLAAPQVGVSLRLLVVGDEETREARALINPVITDQSGQATAEEGCLSIPGIFAPVTRAAWVRMEALDPGGQTVKMDARGLLARVLQHEIDHLDGVLFIDRLDPVTRDRIKRKIRKEGLSEGASHHAFAL